jgi:hypothetical protein
VDKNMLEKIMSNPLKQSLSVHSQFNQNRQLQKKQAHQQENETIDCLCCRKVHKRTNQISDRYHAIYISHKQQTGGGNKRNLTPTNQATTMPYKFDIPYFYFPQICSKGQENYFEPH